VRMAAADALVDIGDESAVEPLITVLQEDEDSGVRKSVVYALANFGTARALEPLLEALQDADSGVRMAAADILAEFGDSRAVAESLNAALDEGDLAVAAGACDYFIKEGIEGSESMLVDALNAYGDEDMAEIFLNCGNSQLASAAEDWAKAYGYTIEPYYGDAINVYGWGTD